MEYTHDIVDDLQMSDQWCKRNFHPSGTVLTWAKHVQGVGPATSQVPPIKLSETNHMLNIKRTDRQHGMVGVEEGVCHNLPCLFPCQVLVINKNAHQLGNSQSRVSLEVLSKNDRYDGKSYIIQLNGDIWDPSMR